MTWRISGEMEIERTGLKQTDGNNRIHFLAFLHTKCRTKVTIVTNWRTNIRRCWQRRRWWWLWWWHYDNDALLFCSNCILSRDSAIASFVVSGSNGLPFEIPCNLKNRKKKKKKTVDGNVIEFDSIQLRIKMPCNPKKKKREKYPKAKR